jgi:hypothetical protein
VVGLVVLLLLVLLLVYLTLTGFPTARPGVFRICTHVLCALACGSLAIAAFPGTPFLVLCAGGLAAFAVLTTVSLLRHRAATLSARGRR